MAKYLNNIYIRHILFSRSPFYHFYFPYFSLSLCMARLSSVCWFAFYSLVLRFSIHFACSPVSPHKIFGPRLLILFLRESGQAYEFFIRFIIIAITNDAKSALACVVVCRFLISMKLSV